jgi:hypothetical protein
MTIDLSAVRYNLNANRLEGIKIKEKHTKYLLNRQWSRFNESRTDPQAYPSAARKLILGKF